MSHILAKLTGVKIEDVQKALKADESKHAEHGLELEHVWENDDDHNEVQFLFKSSDLEHARKFISQVHASAREKDPSINLPSMTYLAGEDGWDFDLDLELPEGEGSEKDKEKKESSPSSDASSLPLNSLAVAASSALIGAALGAGGVTILYCPAPEPLPIVEVVETTEAPVVKTAPTTPHTTGTPASTATGVKTPPTPPTETSTGTGAPMETGGLDPAVPTEETPPTETPPEESSGGGTAL